MKNTLATIAMALAITTATVAAPTAQADSEMLSLETLSGRIWCEVTSIQRQTPSSTPFGRDSAWCQATIDQGFDQRPNMNQVGTSGDGDLAWQAGNMSSANTRLKMQYGQTYSWGNWSIYADDTGTRFTNTRTGQGMFVSIENVYAF